MKVPKHVLKRFRDHPGLLRLPLEPMHEWRSSPDEGAYTYCASCSEVIYRGDPVVGCYLEYISVVFCPDCVADNPGRFSRWLRPLRERPT